MRLATIEAAGQASVPYTSGLLIGIGETREERLQSLLDLRRLHCQYGHIQVCTLQLPCYMALKVNCNPQHWQFTEGMSSCSPC